jgi:hypothetical protein
VIMGDFKLAVGVVHEESFEAELILSVQRCLAEDGIVPVKSSLHIEEFGRLLVADLTTIFLRKMHFTDEARINCGPDGVWQAFRQRWFPMRWLSKHPVRCRFETVTVSHYRTCPHVSVSTDQRTHFAWMAGLDYPSR